jgi:hypothetical protein
VRAQRLTWPCLKGAHTFEHEQVQDGGFMGILSWIVLGAVAGWIASLLVNKAGEGFLLDILLGIQGG